MQFTTVALAALSATGAFAAPLQTVDNSVVVTLKQSAGDDVDTSFTKVQLGQAETQMPSSSGPFKQVNLEVGKGVQKQDLRCQVLDHDGKPIVMTRGENLDITFSDADKGEWTFKEESMVSDIVCDPTFEKIGEDAKDITVILSGPSELATQTVFVLGGAKEAKQPIGSFGPYDLVELRVGALVEKQDIRCKIQDMDGMDIIIKRGENVDITFSDAGKGAWTFLQPEETDVHQIICDPDFVAQKIIV